MSKVKDILQEIELNFSVNEIKVDGENFWPLFRSLIYAHLLKGLLLIHPKNYKAIFRKFRNATFQWPNWYRKYDYIVFSNELERKQSADGYIDKLAEGLIRKLGYDKTLYIELVSKNHLDKKHYGQKIVASMDFVLVLAGIYKIFKSRTFVKEEVVWNRILSQYNLKIDYHEGLDIFVAKIKVLEIILKRLNPKMVFITDYGYFPITFAAKKLGIKVIEFQHGVIGHAHPFYQPAIRLNPMFCPDYMLVFGLNDVNGLSHDKYVQRERILPIGNYYLSKLVKERRNQELVLLLEGYKYSIGIPTDFTTHEYLLKYICSVAKDLSECIFLISPRMPGHLEPSGSALPENVRIIANYPYQEIIRHCDFNTSTNSTCCLEALALGASNILIDDDGIASTFFGRILTDERVTVFVKNKEDYKQHIKTVKPLPRYEVQESSVHSYMADYEQCLARAINTIKK